jgi:murein DD-endopeptidase MepM/ murein hydrolase activator NlpD
MSKNKWFLTFFIIILLMPCLSKNAIGISFGDPVHTEFKYYSRTVQSNPEHTGIDIVGESPGDIKGQDAKASEQGTVVFAGEGKPYTGFGKIVVIDHGDGYQTRYAHLEEIDDAIK